MSGKLPAGHRITTVLGKTMTVEKHLGEGGQGDVYLVNYEGQKKALKWYKENGMGKDPKAFYENIRNNAEHGAPSKDFLWPEDITGWVDGTFGYVMDLRPEGYYEVTEYMLTNVRFSSYRTIIDAALRIVTAYRLLHNQGYSYQDLNDGNFFINPDNGKVLICDNDNAAPNGFHTGIIGKPRYMAPEIVSGGKMPDFLTDRFSMSVILFILFCLQHPLEGKRSLAPCLSPALQEKLYGSEACFIMDPDNKENGPDPKIHRNVSRFWPYLPAYMKELFLKTFSQKALKNPSARPAELEWVNALVRFRSEIVPCSCGNEVFTDGGVSCKCDRCRKPLNIPFRLVLDEYSIPALMDSRIYRCQVAVCKADEALKPVGRVVNEDGKLKVKNLSERTWNATTPSGNAKKVAPKELIPLKDGITFHIESSKIQIKSN